MSHIIPRFWRDRENILAAVSVEVTLSSGQIVMLLAPTVPQLKQALTELKLSRRNEIELVAVMPHHVYYADHSLYRNRPDSGFGITETGGTAMETAGKGWEPSKQLNTIIFVRGFTYTVLGLRGATVYEGQDKNKAIEEARKFHAEQERIGRIKIRRIGKLSDVPVAPGAVLVDYMTRKLITMRELANSTGIPYVDVCLIVAGKKAIHESEAALLASTFENSALFWNDLQKHYEEKMLALVQAAPTEEEH